MSAPPDNRQNNMSGANHQENSAHESASNVRHIPIFVEGRDEPVINKSADHNAYAPPPAPHIDRDQYFADDGPVSFHHPPNFARAFGTPYKGFRQGPQPFTQQKAYPQTAFARGASPQRSQSPKPAAHPEEHYVKVPVHHDAPPRAETPSRAPRPQQPPPPKQASPQPQPHPPARDHTPPPKQTTPTDPITLILSIQTDVLNLMTDVENFTGTKKDKRYIYLDEMLTRNLIKLDNIETEGKENIRLARKEAIRCIQKCIAVLEAKAEKGGSTPQPQVEPQSEPPLQSDVDMQENTETVQETVEKVVENGDVDIKEEVTKEKKGEVPSEEKPAVEPTQEKEEKVNDIKNEAEAVPSEAEKATQPQAADTRPAENVPEQNTTDDQKVENVDKKPNPKKATKVVKKRDKSKDKKEEPKDSNKQETAESKVEVMQVDDKGDKGSPQVMEVDGAASQ